MEECRSAAGVEGGLVVVRGAPEDISNIDWEEIVQRTGLIGWTTKVMDQDSARGEVLWTNGARIRQSVKEEHDRQGKPRVISRHTMFGAVARGVSLRDGVRCWPVMDEVPEEEEEEPQNGEEPEHGVEEPGRLLTLTERQEKFVMKHHVNMGHPASSHARPEITQHVDREFACDICRAHRSPSWRRRVGIPPTYQLNRMVALNTVFMKVAGDTVPVLNIVDHGKNYQVCTVMSEATSAEVSRAFQDRWVRCFGCPEVVLTGGGPE